MYIYIPKSSQFQLFHVKMPRRMDVFPDKGLLDFLDGLGKEETRKKKQVLRKFRHLQTEKKKKR